MFSEEHNTEKEIELYEAHGGDRLVFASLLCNSSAPRRYRCRCFAP